MQQLRIRKWEEIVGFLSHVPHTNIVRPDISQ